MASCNSIYNILSLDTTLLCSTLHAVGCACSCACSMVKMVNWYVQGGSILRCLLWKMFSHTPHLSRMTYKLYGDRRKQAVIVASCYYLLMTLFLYCPSCNHQVCPALPLQQYSTISAVLPPLTQSCWWESGYPCSDKPLQLNKRIYQVSVLPKALLHISSMQNHCFCGIPLLLAAFHCFSQSPITSCSPVIVLMT